MYHKWREGSHSKAAERAQKVQDYNQKKANQYHGNSQRGQMYRQVAKDAENNVKAGTAYQEAHAKRREHFKEKRQGNNPAKT